MKITTIDGINYVHQTIETVDGPKDIEGITVRALRKVLSQADQDAMIIYLGELSTGIIFGCIAGAGECETGNGSKVLTLFGPDAAHAIIDLAIEEIEGE